VCDPTTHGLSSFFSSDIADWCSELREVLCAITARRRTWSRKLSFIYIRNRRFLMAPKVKNWIVQIALHRALDRRAHLLRRGFYVGTDIRSLGDTLVGETDLDREVGAKLDWEQLQKAFEQLPQIQRLTLELYYFEGLDLREISEKLQESLGNTRHHFYRGLERLRKNVFVQHLRTAKKC